jgi:hypothetical protein
MSDDDDYPTEQELETITNWPYEDFEGWMAYIKGIWHFADWGWSEVDGIFLISTGGWSGNESIISAMEKNFILWSSHWISSRRGGHHKIGPSCCIDDLGDPETLEMAKAVGFELDARGGSCVVLHKDKQIVTFSHVHDGWMYKWERGPGLCLGEGHGHKDLAGAFKAWFGEVVMFTEFYLAYEKIRAHTLVHGFIEEMQADLVDCRYSPSKEDCEKFVLDLWKPLNEAIKPERARDRDGEA